MASPHTADRPTVNDTWEMYRNLISHEDQLVNHRITWYILLQGLLATGTLEAIKLSYSPSANPRDPRLDDFIDAFLPSLLAFGVLCSWVAQMSIWASLVSIRGKMVDWEILRAEVVEFKGREIPDIIGGRMYVPTGKDRRLFENRAQQFLFGLSWTSLPFLGGAVWLFLLYSHWNSFGKAAVLWSVTLLVLGVVLWFTHPLTVPRPEDEDVEARRRQAFRKIRQRFRMTVRWARIVLHEEPAGSTHHHSPRCRD